MLDQATGSTSKTRQVWVLAACFNEEDVICRFIEEVLALQDVSHLVLVDDGSRDRTVERIRSWQAERTADDSESAVSLIELTRNFGKESAMLAGLDYVRARCDAVVLIDSDLQHPPSLIPEMVNLWRDGAEVVTAVRDKQDEESRLKIKTASWFYRVFNRLVDSIQLQEGAGDFRLLSAAVVDALTQMREYSRFSKGLLPWTGYRSVEVSYVRVTRPGGSSSWTPMKLWSYALDGIFSFTVLPLQVWTLMGLAVSLISLIYASIIVIRTFVNGVGVPGYPSLIVAILFLGGVQLIGIGVLGEYIGRIYVDSQARPHYFIRAIHQSPQS